MISKLSDRAFRQDLEDAERCLPRLLADPHYGPILRARGADQELDDMRREWRERLERQRARRLRYESSFAEG
ncbi:hypothetical protein [Curtobacterium sp. ISL-83]|uniref:hypothetical protein n=1 Tax=Curtobacterium sp. ISL-83 TaxID=2819145 RepID=UPI001BE550B4|nr:hypothetical protein [Curtobacterium sp. ISL-83]MBT2502517.1 hypothetical protein [Curtobacterium sp. ISL-83]